MSSATARNTETLLCTDPVSDESAPRRPGLYIMLLSVHGLIRGEDLELGRDADTGGQTKYVVELAKALALHANVSQVDLVTRKVLDRAVSGDYARAVEPLEVAPTDACPEPAPARIVRIACGPDKYLAKETLWPHLDTMVDRLLDEMRKARRVPDLIHGHYADAGYVALRLSGLLDVPMVYTGHSLGRVKKERLLAGGLTEEQIERRYRISRRIEAEEQALDSAHLVIASTQQEVDEQYGMYANHDSGRMSVVPPGVDLERFGPPKKGDLPSPIERDINRFLSVPEKPAILALSRPDPRKNIPRLVEAFGEHPHLREMANLVLVAGNRDRIEDLDSGAKETWWTLLQSIDRLDLHGSVAYPKHHTADDVPDIYRLAAKRKGIFINPALTEPFGLTLLEAAASGVPVVATDDGGPREILDRCKNGLLIDALDVEGIGEALAAALSDRQRWRQWQKNGLKGVARHYSWKAHVDRYMKLLRWVVFPKKRQRRQYRPRGRLLTADRMLVSNIDNTLLGRKEQLRELMRRIKGAGSKVAFGVATGRGLEAAQEVLSQHKDVEPDFWITSVGSAIYYGKGMVEDRGWQHHIDYRWRPERLAAIALDFPGIERQPPEGQDTFKISFFVRDPDRFDVKELERRLRKARLAARVVYSYDAFLDLVPVRASKGLAVRYLAMRLGIPLDMVLVAGDAGNDEDMLRGDTLGVVVGNHDDEVESLRGESRIYFAEGTYARGILEGIDHYHFLDDPLPHEGD